MKKFALLSIFGILFCQIIFGQNFIPRQSHYRDFQLTPNGHIQCDDEIMNFIRQEGNATLNIGATNITIERKFDPSIYAIYGLEMFHISINNNRPCHANPISKAELDIIHSANVKLPLTIIVGDIFIDNKWVVNQTNKILQKLPGKVLEMAKYRTFNPNSARITIGSPYVRDPGSRVITKYKISLRTESIFDMMNFIDKESRNSI